MSWLKSSAQIDEHYHATTSREVGVKPLRRKTKKPYHYLDFTPEGTDPWQNPELKKPRKPLALLAYERAKSSALPALGKVRVPVVTSGAVVEW